jgi:hypothetical protein
MVAMGPRMREAVKASPASGVLIAIVLYAVLMARRPEYGPAVSPVVNVYLPPHATPYIFIKEIIVLNLEIK